MTKNPWPIVRLAEVLTERRETPNPTKILSGEIPIVSKIGFDTGRIELRNSSQTKTGMILIQPGDLVLSGINAAKGAIAIYDKENTTPIAATIHYGAYTPNERKVDLRYLWHFLRSRTFQEILTQHMPCGIKTELKATRFLAVPVPLPSLSDQRRILARIDQLAAKIEQARSIRESLRPLAHTLFLANINTLIIDCSKVHPGSPLIDLVEPDRGISYGIVQTGKPFQGGVPTLRAGNLQEFYVNLSNVKQVDPKIEAKYLRTRLKGNELLLRIRGGLGEVAICPPEMIGGNVSREIAVIPLRNHIDPTFAMFAVAAPSNQDFLRQHTRGTSYIGINLNDVRRLTIPVPSLDKQRQIVSYLNNLQAKINKLKDLQNQTAAELDSLLPSLLHKAFTGQL
jgi:type I restriction enzyme S subunit